ncbi:hypothetical protein ACED32_18225, partial [Vibrio bivalvicida]|uniref:hypothetical protein n=1 Tax=Vibrio bivalvicida TaxID=1276888 RepID=UPI00352D1DC8
PDPLVPNQMRYQAALFTDELFFYLVTLIEGLPSATAYSKRRYALQTTLFIDLCFVPIFIRTGNLGYLNKWGG